MSEIIKEILLKYMVVSLIASALILAIQLISPLLKKRFSARWRYWAWLILALWLLIPVTFPLSQAPIQISVPDTAIVQSAAEITSAATEPQTDNTATESPTDTTNMPQTTQGEHFTQEKATSASKTETATFFTTVTAFLSGYTVLDLIVAVWSAGTVIVLFCRWIAALRFKSKLRRRWRPCDSPTVVRSIRGAMEGMDFHKEIDIKFCKEVKSPFMTGLFRPVMVLPEQEFDPYLLAHIVRHEITHFRRRDLWYKSVINFATAVHWFNPFVRVMSRASDRDLELVCDELVTKNHDLNNRKAYGESILLTVKPGLDRRPAALTTSFSRGAKNLKERFESIMLMKAKNSGIAFLALILMLAVLASCGTGLDINKFDWTLYTNTEWRCEEADADIYFKDKAKGIVFDLYISQICIVENAETTGKLKTSDEGYVDTFDGEYSGTSIKASITFSHNGDYLIVTITEAGGVAANLGEYRFVRINNSSSYTPVSSIYEIVGTWSEANEDGTFPGGENGPRFGEGIVTGFIFNGDGTGYLYTVGYSNSLNQSASSAQDFEITYSLGKNGVITIVQSQPWHNPNIVMPSSFKTITVYVAKMSTFVMLKIERADGHIIFLRSNSPLDDGSSPDSGNGSGSADMNLYNRFLAVELGMTLEQVENTFGEQLQFTSEDRSYKFYHYYVNDTLDGSAGFAFIDGKLMEKTAYKLNPLYFDSSSEDAVISEATYESFQLGVTYNQVVAVIGNGGILEKETYRNVFDEYRIIKTYNWFVDGDYQVNFVFENDILTEKFNGSDVVTPEETVRLCFDLYLQGNYAQAEALVSDECLEYYNFSEMWFGGIKSGVFNTCEEYVYPADLPNPYPGSTVLSCNFINVIFAEDAADYSLNDPITTKTILLFVKIVDGSYKIVNVSTGP